MLRNSQLAMLTGLGVVLLGIVVVVGSIRLAISNYTVDDENGRGDETVVLSDQTSLSPDLTGFSSIEIHESWSLEITQADSWSVELSVPDDRADDVEVGVRGNRLVLDSNDDRRGPWRWFGGRDRALTAKISMPALTGLDIVGAGNIEFDGFRGERLNLVISGAGNIEGFNGAYDQLDLTISGAANVQIKGVPVRSANVELSGASNVELRMEGGELTGSLSGFGNVSYTGSVSNQSVRVSGFGRVDRED